MARRGRELLVEVLQSEGVRHVFGNPGTTELPLVEELAAHPDITYVHALQENSAVAMADGYAQATRRPAFVNLHTAAGLGGGMGNLTNALACGTPLVVTAGQQDRRHLIADPLLAGDLTGLARPVSKWQHEVRHPSELGVVLRRAFKDAMAPPRGPTFVSIPMDVLEEESDAAVPQRSRMAPAPAAAGLEEAAALLAAAAPDEIALVVGDEVAWSEAVPAVVALAERLGCTVYGAPMHSNLDFPTDHPLWAGPLVPSAARLNSTLASYSCVLLVGAPAFLTFKWSPGPAVPEGTSLVHVMPDAERIGRTHAADLGLVGDVRATVEVLARLVGPLVDEARVAEATERQGKQHRVDAQRLDERARGRYDEPTMHPMAAAHALVRALPAGAVVVDEAVTAGPYVRGFHRVSAPGSYYFCRSGGLGWALPASVGVKLAQPERPVLCAVGDGAFMYSPQALWTAARYEVPVVVAVFTNGVYRILKDELAGRPAVGLSLAPPVLDFVAMAASMGVPGLVVEKASDVSDAAREAFAGGRPFLIELPVAA